MKTELSQSRTYRIMSLQQSQRQVTVHRSDDDECETENGMSSCTHPVFIVNHVTNDKT